MLETTFHLGVHRCATTSFQAYLDQNARNLAQAGVAAWTPKSTRQALFAGRPRRQFKMLSGRIDVAGLLDQTPHWKNTSRNLNKLRHILKTKGQGDMVARLPRGCGTWMPFEGEDRAAMRAQYSADKNWLRNAGPQITFHEKTAIKVPRKIDMTGGYHEPTRLMG